MLAIISLSAALLFPVFMTVRGQARQVACAANLHQTGLALAMYLQDADGLYPYAVDPSDRSSPGLWSEFPAFQSAIPTLPWLQDALGTYTQTRQVWRCPSDSGFLIHDWTNAPLDAMPSSYEKFGTSYYYRTELAARRIHEGQLERPAEINLLLDGAGHWHGRLMPIVKRYNILFADAHVKNLSHEQAIAAWKLPLSNPEIIH